MPSPVDADQDLEVGWSAPDKLPDAFGHSPDGSPNYYLHLADPVPLEELAQLSIATLVCVHGAEHPNGLEYSTGSADCHEVRLPAFAFGGCGTESTTSNATIPAAGGGSTFGITLGKRIDVALHPG